MYFEAIRGCRSVGEGRVRSDVGDSRKTSAVARVVRGCDLGVHGVDTSSGEHRAVALEIGGWEAKPATAAGTGDDPTFYAVRASENRGREFDLAASQMFTDHRGAELRPVGVEHLRNHLKRHRGLGEHRAQEWDGPLPAVTEAKVLSHHDRRRLESAVQVVFDEGPRGQEGNVGVEREFDDHVESEPPRDSLSLFRRLEGSGRSLRREHLHRMRYECHERDSWSRRAGAPQQFLVPAMEAIKRSDARRGIGGQGG